jgi:hypothetical protein
MDRIKIKSNTIEIHRNPIERFLMFLKNFIKTKRVLVPIFSLVFCFFPCWPSPDRFILRRGAPPSFFSMNP